MSRELVRRFFEGDDLPTLRDDLFFPFQQVFDEVFDSFWSGSTLDKVKAKSGYPKVEIGVEGDNWVVRAAIPGVKKEDLSLEIIDNSKGVHQGQHILKIQGKMSEVYESPKDTRYYCKELRKTAFTREIIIPETVEEFTTPETNLEDGILTMKWKNSQGNTSKNNITQINIK